MSFRSTVVAAAALFTIASAHIVMENPVPFDGNTNEHAPITGPLFPCNKYPGFKSAKTNALTVGQEVPLKFSSGANHGGSCQVSVTTDTEPNANSVFKVVKSFEGGCPGPMGGQASDKLTFSLPESIPNGKGTLIWTWFAAMAGQPEMYVDCAPIEVTGGASDKSGFEALPNMLVANIAALNTCTRPTDGNSDLTFPDPGQVVENNAGTEKLAPPTGDCGSTGNSPAVSSVAGGAPSATPSAAPSAAPSASPVDPVASGVVTSAAPSAVPSNPGGVFAPGASGASTMTTLITVTAAPGTGSPSTPTTPATPPTSGGTGTCTENGAVVCNGPTQFGLCNNGQVVWQAVAAGTTCENGAVQKRGYTGRFARPRAVIPGKDYTPSI